MLAETLRLIVAPDESPKRFAGCFDAGSFVAAVSALLDAIQDFQPARVRRLLAIA